MNAGVQPEGDHAQQKSNQQKALRFVTNYGAPHPKRRRIGAACLTCRKRKTACSGERPFCETCRQNKLECAGYNPEPDGDGRKRSMSEVNTRQAPEVKEKQRVERAKRKSPPDARQEHGKDQDASVVVDPALSQTGPSQNGGEQSPRTVSSILAADLGTSGGPEPLFSGPRNRMPYFRWLGPTAIMPGFKQMVVKVKRQGGDPMGQSSTDENTSPSLGTTNIYSTTPAAVESDMRTPLNLPFYDTSPMPPSELITHLANTFFTHLGCNYHFLQRDRFLRDLEEKQVDAILVDAVCALAARFSTHPLLTKQPRDDPKSSSSDYGHAFSQRAKASLVDAFAYPTPAAVQAALLLAYNEFGESRDSGLWMYLGIAIRMAEDLGMHKLEGLKFKGKEGPTPKTVKRESFGGGFLTSPQDRRHAGPAAESAKRVSDDDREQEAVEQERVDTFWAIFFLDRVVSSGTGRRSALRDRDIELSFPSLDETDPKTGWPAPFPALIRIVHLYGRVADLLNCIKAPSDVTSDTPKRLAAMESQVTMFYQGLSSRLHFDAMNFQHYMKAGEGTNFVLLHFWFHTLIVLLHQPTLLKTFEGRMLQLFPNSQQLSMSSAKTIADILSYSQLMDAKASLGNPFTTQPIYIAACAFLKETAEQTATSNAQTRTSSPARRSESSRSANGTPQNGKKSASNNSSTGKRTPNLLLDQKALARHTLLATAASQHYQLCYKALQSIEKYWGGTKYILTVLDQKFEGIGDPLLYTAEEGESSMERPKPDPAFTSPGWRRKLKWGMNENHPATLPKQHAVGNGLGSPGADPGNAIGWTLTGTMNSPSTHLAWHYPSATGDAPARGQSVPSGFTPTDYDTSVNLKPPFQQPTRGVSVGARQRRPPLTDYPSTASGVSAADADLLLGLGSPYTQTNSSHQTPGNNQLSFTNQGSSSDPSSTFALTQGANNMPTTNYASPFFGQLDSQNFGDMTIQSRDVDMSLLGLDTLPWFDSYPAQDLSIDMFDPGDTVPSVDSSMATGQPSTGQQ